MGTIAGIAAIAAFIAAAVMLVLGGLGLMHARRTSPDAEILTRHSGRGTGPATIEPGRERLTSPVPVNATTANGNAAPHS